MGYMRHNAILVTGYMRKDVEAAHVEAVALFGQLVSPIVDSAVNDHPSFFVAPDGSKEGWGDSHHHDKLREVFRRFLHKQSGLNWAEVVYGDEEGPTRIVDSDRLDQ